MTTMLRALQQKIDLANVHRKVDDPITPMAHIIARSTRPDGDPDFLNAAVILSIGDDYIEVKGQGMIDRRELRNVQPINF